MDTMCVDAMTIRSAPSPRRARPPGPSSKLSVSQPSARKRPTPSSWSSPNSSPTPYATAAAPTPSALTANPHLIEVAVVDPSPRAPRIRTPDLNGDTEGFDRGMANRLAHSTKVTRRTTGGKTVSALPAR